MGGAVGRLRDRPGELGVCDELSDRLGGERLEAHRQDLPAEGGKPGEKRRHRSRLAHLLGAVGEEHPDPGAGDDEAEQVEAGCIRPLQVVDHHQGSPGPQRPQQQGGALERQHPAALGVEDPRPGGRQVAELGHQPRQGLGGALGQGAGRLAVQGEGLPQQRAGERPGVVPLGAEGPRRDHGHRRVGRHLGEQAGLAHPGDAGDDHRGGGGTGEGGVDGGQLGLPAHEGELLEGGQAPGDGRGPGGGRGEGLSSQQPCLQGCRLRGEVDAELVGEAPPEGL